MYGRLGYHYLLVSHREQRREQEKTKLVAEQDHTQSKAGFLVLLMLYVVVSLAMGAIAVATWGNP